MIRCPECSAEIDVDEDEVEEGEILSCPECESELEVSQTHPVHLNVISDDLDEEEEEVPPRPALRPLTLYPHQRVIAYGYPDIGTFRLSEPERDTRGLRHQCQS